MSAPVARRTAWRLAGEMLARPFPLRPRVVVPAVTLMVLVPVYLVIPWATQGRALHLPETTLDRLVPVQPAWAVIYLSYFLFPILTVLVVRQEELIRRTFLAWLMVWLTGYACFLVYPTILPRAVGELGPGFFAWFLRGIYDADAPRNCLPSLHVASPFVSALTIWRVHRGVGLAVGAWAALIALSTVFTKQHYVADVVSGILLAFVAGAVFLRNCPREPLSENDRHAIPLLVMGVIGVYALVVAGLWVAYRIG